MTLEEQHASAYMLGEVEPSGKTRQLVCHFCGKTFPNMAALAGHIRSHKQASRIDFQQQAILEALNKQAAALEAIARELAAIRHLLASLNIVEAKVEKRVVSVAQPEAPPEKQPKTGNLPSFLEGNPWVAILSRRGREP
jgi:hypothetical protein